VKPARVHLERPAARHRDEFLAAVRRSRRLHGQFASPPSDRRAYDAWLKRLGGPSAEGHLVISDEHAALGGVININELVGGNFQSGYLGYYAFEPHAGHGLMRAGLRLVIRRAFGELRLHRLEANIQPENAPSIALVQALGFELEGFSPRYVKIGGRWRDHERWALLRENWRAR
jgi:ribosomal-protein-alanine N-acetyltransferase